MFICPPPPTYKKENQSLEPPLEGNEKKTILKLQNWEFREQWKINNNNHDDVDNEQ